MIVLQSIDRSKLFQDLDREMNKYPYGGYSAGPLTQTADGLWQLPFWPPK